MWIRKLVTASDTALCPCLRSDDDDDEEKNWPLHGKVRQRNGKQCSRLREGNDFALLGCPVSERKELKYLVSGA
jgi:hypothetical protein